MLYVSTHTEKIELNVREETMMMSMTTYELCVLCVFLTFCTLYKPGNVIFKGKVGHWKLKFFTSTFQADMLRLERVLSFNNNIFFVLLTLRFVSSKLVFSHTTNPERVTEEGWLGVYFDLEETFFVNVRQYYFLYSTSSSAIRALNNFFQIANKAKI